MKFLFAKDGFVTHKIYFDDILYIESLKDYVKIKTAQKTHIVHGTMNAMEKRFESYDFVRASRTHIVSVEKIDRIMGDTIYIAGDMLDIGEQFKKKFNEVISRWKI